jgi:hypothetical protein
MKPVAEIFDALCSCRVRAQVHLTYRKSCTAVGGGTRAVIARARRFLSPHDLCRIVNIVVDCADVGVGDLGSL